MAIRQVDRIRRPRVYQEVADRIQRMIASGHLRPGDRLPPERELAEQFGVSRTSVRDAIRVLELLGQVEARQGEGTIVREGALVNMVAPLATAVSMQRAFVGDLMEVRLLLEPAMAAHAAERATSDELAELDALLARQELKVREGVAAVDEDAAFHYLIARASRNQVVLRVVDVLMDLLRESRQRSLQLPGRARSSLAGHRRILAALRAGRADVAAAAMRAHLTEIQALVLSGRDPVTLSVGEA